MKNVMKTILRNTKLVMVLAFLPALLSAAQAQAVTYQTKYKNAYQGAYVQTPGNASATTASPSVGFQSTSAFSDQWNTEEGTTPMLNSDGTVNGEAYMGAPKHPGRIRREGPGTPTGPLNPNEQQPLGDVMWPLILCACAYLIVRATRKEEKIG